MKSPTWLQRRVRPAVGMAAVVALTGCAAAAPRVVAPAQVPQVSPAASPQAAVQQQEPAFTAKLQFTPPRAPAGTTVQVRGSGYPAGADVDLVWYTSDGRYELDNGTEFVGGRYDPRTSTLTTLRASPSGDIAGSFSVPIDFGGAHDVRGRVAGQELSQASVTIEPAVTMTPQEGPIGTPVELRIVGVDSRVSINTWHLMYDNRFTGFLSAVTTHGVAVARFRAAGPVGQRAVSVWHNSFYPTPYLNWQQGPNKDVPDYKFTFNVTMDSGPPAMALDDFNALDNPWPVPAGSGSLALTVDRGPVGTPTTLHGSGLPPNKELVVDWQTMVGNRVTPSGFSEQLQSLGAVVTDANGAFVRELAIPDDLGGQHRVDVTADGKVWASTGVVIQPSVLEFGPARVRAGEQVKLHLKGVGWTTYDNTYAVTYDNSYVGYACGFSTNGDVQFSLTATGAPGTHLIDLYPTIYKGADAMPRVYSIPQLTYADDHPQRKTPAIRLAIEII